MRGAALKLTLPDGEPHDLLMTSFPVSHARDARQFVEFALLASGDKATFPARLAEHFGQDETRRMLANLRQGMRGSTSLALERFWSRGAVLWAGAPVRFQLQPEASNTPAPTVLADTPDALHDEFASRLAAGPVRYRLALQRYVDEQKTPIEDGSVEWTEQDSPPIIVATIIIPQQESTDEAAVAEADQVERMSFNPWNAPAEFRPLGNLNRARKTVYGMSAARWRR
jgi:hypothetical protein